MIVVAGLLVFGGLGVFVAGVLTGVTALYWACVGACLVAAVLLFLARRRMGAPAAPAAAAPVGAPGATSSSPAEGLSTGRHAVIGRADATQESGSPVVAPSNGYGASGPPRAAGETGEPSVEEVEVTDLLLVVDLKDEVLVVDEHPRYHVAGCRHLAGQRTFPLPVDEAKNDGFTPCGTCRPDATLADRARAERMSPEG